MKKTFSILLSTVLVTFLNTDAKAASFKTIGQMNNSDYHVALQAQGLSSYNSDNFFKLSLFKTKSFSYLSSMTLDIKPAGGFFDITSDLPGMFSSPLKFSNLNGLTLDDITPVVSDGSSILTLNFAPNTFNSGDSISFGLDIDRIGIGDSSFSACALKKGNPNVLFDFEPVPNPEPASVVFGAMGLVGLLGLRRK